MVEFGGKVCCPLPNCKAFFDPLLGSILLAEHIYTRYSRLLQTAVYENNESFRTRCKEIMAELVLTCPSCHSAVDPSPDACSAVQCLGKY